MHVKVLTVAAIVAAAFPVSAATAADQASLQVLVDGAIRPVMKQYAVPGMAVGVVTPNGEKVFDYGVASKETGAKVSEATLFEIGSISKTFTAALTAYAVDAGDLKLSDSVADHLPDLKGTDFGHLSLLELGTHMTGGLSLQVPDGVNSEKELIDHLKGWKPKHAPGTYRSYSNISIGLLGAIAAKTMKGNFATLERDHVIRPLGLTHTFLTVPADERSNYAQGYKKTGEPIRMAPGVLDMEAYGVRTTAGDMAHYLAAQIGLRKVSGPLKDAIEATHTGYFTSGPMTQDLIWEQYPWPVSRDDLVLGNSAKFGFADNPATRIDPPMKPRRDALLNKTGSTNGFGAYVAFVPEKKIGVVILANRNYPLDARVRAGYAILQGLAGGK